MHDGQQKIEQHRLAALRIELPKVAHHPLHKIKHPLSEPCFASDAASQRNIARTCMNSSKWFLAQGAAPGAKAYRNIAATDPLILYHNIAQLWVIFFVYHPNYILNFLCNISHIYMRDFFR